MSEEGLAVCGLVKQERKGKMDGDTSGDEEDDTRLVIDEENAQYGCMEDLPCWPTQIHPMPSTAPHLVQGIGMHLIKDITVKNLVPVVENIPVENVSTVKDIPSQNVPVVKDILSENLIPEAKDKLNVNLLLCPCCPKKFTRKVNLVGHLRSHKSATKYRFSCSLCGEKFQKKRLLNFHVYCHNNQAYECYECGKKFIYKKNLVTHQRDHERGTSHKDSGMETDPIKFCEVAKFETSSGYWSMKCRKCGKVTNSQHDYDKHMNLQCDNTPYLGSSCSEELDLQLSRHNADKQLERIQCDTTFEAPQKLYDHKLSHNAKSISFEICDEDFTRVEEFTAHISKHDTVLYTCPICKMSCSSKKSLEIHLLSHTAHIVTQDQDLGDDSHEAKEAVGVQSSSKMTGASSPPSSKIKKYNEIFVCHKCGEDYQSKQALLDHIAIHFQCKKCKMMFKNQRAINMHLIFLGDKKIISCCICGNLLHGKKELERHLSDHITTEYQASKNSDWEEKTKMIQTLITDLKEDSVNPSSSAVVEENIKIHKVTHAGRNSLRCSACRKLVHLHHNLDDHMQPNIDTEETGEEFVYITRLENPRNNRKMTNLYCKCSNNTRTIGVSAPESLQRSSLGKIQMNYTETSPSFTNRSSSQIDVKDLLYPVAHDAGIGELGLSKLNSLALPELTDEGEYSATLDSNTMIKIGREVGPNSIKSNINVLSSIDETGLDTKEIFGNPIIKKEFQPIDVFIKEEWDVDLNT